MEMGPVFTVCGAFEGVVDEHLDAVHDSESCDPLMMTRPSMRMPRREVI